MGGSKLWYMYRKNFEGDHSLGRDRLADIVDGYGLKVRLKVRKPRTTDSTHGLPVFPNPTKDCITSGSQPPVGKRHHIHDDMDDAEHYRFCYLSLILDAYSEEIVGWCIGETLDTVHPIKALEMAPCRIAGTEKGCMDLIHNSDWGCRYASEKYVAMLKEHGIQTSMTESGDPKDNAQAVRLNNTMKNELLRGMTCFHQNPKKRNYTYLDIFWMLTEIFILNNVIPKIIRSFALVNKLLKL